MYSFTPWHAQVMTARIMERGRSSGRIDDNEEAIRKRLVTYHESTMPIIKEFEARGKLREINSDQTIGACVGGEEKEGEEEYGAGRAAWCHHCRVAHTSSSWGRDSRGTQKCDGCCAL